MPMGDDPAQSCFTWDNWDKSAFTGACESTYKMTPKYDWALDYFGGRNPCKDFQSSSNIIFSNGNYDPWHGGGVLNDCMVNNKVILMDKSGHHLDLRTPNMTADPPEVTAGREVETNLITKWIEAYQN
jgi:lysosomal Pro-X carboxypeptidase